jgi:hypothetical protein
MKRNNTNNNKAVPEENTYDFGFTFASEEDLISNKSNEDEINDLKNRLQTLSNMFLNLLNNLAKDPDKPMIKWSNRKQMIDQQIEKIKELTNVL